MSNEILSAEEAQSWRDDGVEGTHEQVARMVDTILALYAMLDGSTTPPTIKAARKHCHVTRGSFAVTLGDGNAHCNTRVATGLQRFDVYPQRWIAFDATGRVTSMPTEET